MVPTNKYDSLDDLKQFGSWETSVWRKPQGRPNMRRVEKEISEIPGAKVGPVTAMANAFPIAYTLGDGTIEFDEVVTALGGVQALPGLKSDFQGLVASTLSDELFPMAFPPSSTVKRGNIMREEMSLELAREFLGMLWIGAAAANVPKTAKTAKERRPFVPNRGPNKRSNPVQATVPKPSSKDVKNRLHPELTAPPRPASEANVSKANTNPNKVRQDTGRSLKEIPARTPGGTKLTSAKPEKPSRPSASVRPNSTIRAALPTHIPNKIRIRPL